MKIKQKSIRVITVLFLILSMIITPFTQVMAKNETNVGSNTKTTKGKADQNKNITNESSKMFYGDGFTVTFKIDSQWADAFNGNITITNTGSVDIENWSLMFYLENEITNIWNGKINNKDEGIYCIQNVGWNQDIPVGKSVNFGFTAKSDGVINMPSSYYIPIDVQMQAVDAAGYDVKFIIDNDWKNGFSARINITNLRNETIKGWILSFDLDRSIQTIWNGVVLSNNNNHYIIKNNTYNQNIAPGATVSIGFNGVTGNVISGPSNFQLLQKVDVYHSRGIDTDGDGIDNNIELIMGTNPYVPDIDIENGFTFTRGEWIQLLAEKLEFNLSVNAEEINYTYVDTKNTAYGIAIETAEAYGILPSLDSEYNTELVNTIRYFYPDRIATREFVAYTVVKAMGFYGEFTLDCIDSSSLKYKSESAIAVKQGFLSLIKNCFLPNVAITKEDKDNIFSVIDAINKSTEFSHEDTYENIMYAENVMVDSLVYVTDYIVTHSEDEKVNVIVPANHATNNIKAGDVFILPANEDYITGIALKAVSITINNDNTIFIECTIPELEEIYSRIDFIQFGTASVDNITVADGVTFEYNPYGVVGENDFNIFSIDLITDKTYTLPGTIDFTIYDLDLGNDVTLESKISVAIPEVKVMLDAEIGLFTGIQIHDFLVSMTEEIEYSIEINYSEKDKKEYIKPKSDKKEIARIPIPLGSSGFSVDVIVFLFFKVDGTMSVVAGLEATQGIQVVNGTPRAIRSLSNSVDNIRLEVDVTAGIGVGIRLNTFITEDLFGLAAQFGIGFNVSTILRNTFPMMLCSDVNIYFQGTLEIDNNTIFGNILEQINASWSWDFIDKDKAKISLLHFENFKKVCECSHGEGNITGSVIHAKTLAGIPGARIKIQSGDVDILIYSDSKGNFEISEIPTGEYTIEISAIGYHKLTINRKIEKGEELYLNRALIPKDYVEVKGTVRDVYTGDLLSEVAYTVHCNTEGDLIDSGVILNPNYSILLPIGDYTIEFFKNGYHTTTNHINVASDLIWHVDLLPSSSPEPIPTPMPIPTPIITPKTETLQGRVTIANTGRDNNKNEILPYVDITLVDFTDISNQHNILSDDNGEYKFFDLAPGIYRIIFQKSGYLIEQYTVTINKNDNLIIIPTIALIPEEYYGKGIASGKVEDITNRNGVEGLTLRFRKGLNELNDAEVLEIKTGVDGYYFTEDISAGYYTVQIVDEREVNLSEKYYDSMMFVKVLGGHTLSNQNGFVSSEKLSILLTWTDKDIILYTSVDNYYVENKIVLMKDDETEHLKEISTISIDSDTIYNVTVYVADSLWWGDEYDPISAYGAKVIIFYEGKTLIFDAPNKRGNVWELIELDGTTNEITIKNMVYGIFVV